MNNALYHKGLRELMTRSKTSGWYSTASRRT